MSNLARWFASVCLVGLVISSGCNKKETQEAGGGEGHAVKSLANPGFESGQIGPWVAYGDVKASVDRGAAAHSGQFGLTEPAGNGSAWQDVSGLEAGKTYTISAWVSAQPGGDTVARFAVFNPAASEATFSDEFRPGSSWQHVRYSVHLTKGDTLKIHLWRAPGPSIIYWDDVQVTSD